MSRFRQEWDLIPTAAFVIAGLAFLAYVTLMGSLFLAPPLMEGQGLPLPLVGLFALTLVGGVFMVLFILLLGYVWADAKRRRMNALLWVLLALFIPNAIGIILYFILRDPLAVPCPSCSAPATKDQAFCAACGTAVRPSCPQCRQPVQQGWTHCGRCGAELAVATAHGTAWDVLGRGHDSRFET
jgi:hypothetical protein